MTQKSCKKHNGMIVAYDPRKYRSCLLCARGQQIQFLASAFLGLWKVGSLHIEAMELILKNAPEEQRRDVNMKARETSDKVHEDLESAIEVMVSICV